MFKLVVLLSVIACALGAFLPNGMLPQLDGRIVGGSPASISDYPYQVSLQRSGSHSCGGSLYSTDVVVTAAHCLQNVAVSALRIRVGSRDRTSGGALYNVTSYKTHPGYSSRYMMNDIAVIKLETPVTLGTNVSTIPLASSAPVDGTDAVVTGWGTVSSGAFGIPLYLQEVDVKIISKEVCSSSAYGYSFSDIRDTMICAAAPGKDSCQGDSGGPLVANGVQVGVVSWGYGCAAPEYPGVYADVAALRSWLEANI